MSAAKSPLSLGWSLVALFAAVTTSVIVFYVTPWVIPAALHWGPDQPNAEWVAWGVVMFGVTVFVCVVSWAEVARFANVYGSVIWARLNPGPVIGRYCRTHRHQIEGCSGIGRPSCQAAECLYGAEPCPDCRGFKPEGGKCGFVHGVKQ